MSWFAGNFEPAVRKVALDQLRDLDRTDLLLLWDAKPQQVSPDIARPLIAIPAESMRDFFAFASTFFANYQPFSAFFRVIPVERARDLLDGALNPVARVMPNRFIGAIIAEARAQIGGRIRSPSDVSIQACLATISSAAVTALSAGLQRDQLSSVIDGWIRSRRRLSEEPLRLPPERIRDFWTLVSVVYEDLPLQKMPGGDDAARRIVQFLADVMASPDEGDPETWGLLTQGLPVAQLALRTMHELREDRVRAFDEVAHEIVGTDHIDQRIREVVGGYVATRVAGGSLRYLQLLETVEGALPLASMWFGLFASLRDDSDVMTLGECLGRHVDRHLKVRLDLFSPPDADIAAAELEVLLPEPRTDLKFRTVTQGPLPWRYILALPPRSGCPENRVARVKLAIR